MAKQNLQQENVGQNIAKDSARLIESAIEHNLELTPEQRIEAHENARQLMNDLREAGEKRRAESQSSS